jgi:methylmalonyl-CoA/ethylmalonyl-CoA epimerase
MFEKISHIGVAVKDIETSTELFRRLFGKGPDRTEELPGHMVKTAMFSFGTSDVELTQALDADSPIARFIDKRGEGVHHISFVVDDIVSELARLKKAGFELIDDRPRRGADGSFVAFLNPKSTNGVLVEISQKM